MRNTDKFYKVIRLIIIAAPVILFVFLFYRYLIPSGKLAVNYDFCNESPFISRLSPDGRVLPIEKEQAFCQQKMVIDPVYFDVRLPQSFRQAEIFLEYKKPPEQSLMLGVRNSLDAWSWQVKDVVGYVDQSGRSYAQVFFDLQGAVLENKRLRFIISSPGLETKNQEITFYSLKIKFSFS